MSGFFEIVIKDGKKTETPYKWKHGEYDKYKTVCETIWGGLPLDVNWATNTEIFKTALSNLNSDQNVQVSDTTEAK